MSFLSPRPRSTPTPQAITPATPQIAAPQIDPALPQPTAVLPGQAPTAASALLTDVTNPRLIADTRRRFNLLGSAATTLG